MAPKLHEEHDEPIKDRFAQKMWKFHALQNRQSGKQRVNLGMFSVLTQSSE